MPRCLLLSNEFLLLPLNATPDESDLAALYEAGLVEAAATLGVQPAYTFSSTRPRWQLDYIWVSPDLEPTRFEIIHSTASDHLPIVGTVQIPADSDFLTIPTNP